MSSSSSRSASAVDEAGHELGVSVRVYLAMIPRSHPLGSVRDAYNAVFVEATAAGGADVRGPAVTHGQRGPGRRRGRRPHRSAAAGQ